MGETQRSVGLIVGFCKSPESQEQAWGKVEQLEEAEEKRRRTRREHQTNARCSFSVSLRDLERNNPSFSTQDAFLSPGFTPALPTKKHDGISLSGPALNTLEFLQKFLDVWVLLSEIREFLFQLRGNLE